MSSDSTDRLQWDTRSVGTFSHKMFWRFVYVSVWLYGTKFRELRPSFTKLASRIIRLHDLSGSGFAVSYLKEAYRVSTKTLAGERPETLSEPRVAMRRGLPLIIPGPIRLRMESGDQAVTRLALTMLAVFRVMHSWPKLKLETITGPFTGAERDLPELEQVFKWLEVKFLDSRLMEQHFRMEPSIFTKGAKLLRLTSAGPNHKLQLVGYPLDALALSVNPALLNWFKVFALNTHQKGLWEALQDEIRFCYSASPLPGNVMFSDTEEWRNAWVPIGGMSSLRLGKLSLKYEAAGKVRVFAIVDAWTQSVLHPLHTSLFSILRRIEQDGTFDQIKPVRALFAKGLKDMYSFDLSAATDRLPIDIQVSLLSLLYGRKEPAEAWKHLLIDREYVLDSPSFPDASGAYRYAVGQPMGALSSWAMLALTHHLLVQIASLRVGYTTWFEDYAVLGDDVVIADVAVAQAYKEVMAHLGVDINMSKSVVSSTGVCEFAKKLLVSGKEFGPYGVKELFEFIRGPRHFKELVLNNSVLDLALDELDFVGASKFLASLISAPPTGVSDRWLEKVVGTWWDLLGFFGYNLTKGLSPIISDLAIDSLTCQESEEFKRILRSTLTSMITQGALDGFASDVSMYNLIRRKMSFTWYAGAWPSADLLLSRYSADMGSHLYRPTVDLEKLSTEELMLLAFSRKSLIVDPFASTKKVVKAPSSKSLELSRELLKALWRHSPHIALKLVSNSQAFSEPKN